MQLKAELPALRTNLGRIHVLNELGHHQEAIAVAQDALRISFLHDKLAAFQDLLQIYLSQNSDLGRQNSFALAEQVKSRALIDLVTGIIDSGPDLPHDPQLVAELQTLRADLNATYNTFLGHPTTDWSDHRWICWLRE